MQKCFFFCYLECLCTFNVIKLNYKNILVARVYYTSPYLNAEVELKKKRTTR